MSKNMTVGFIGTGNMGGALAIASRHSLGNSLKILLSNHSAKKARALSKALSGDVEIVANPEVAKRSDFIFLGVKPQSMAEMISEISKTLKERAGKKEEFTLISMAAGQNIAKISEFLGGNFPIIRILPNTPVAIGKGIILYAPGPGIEKDVLTGFRDLLRDGGLLFPIPEKLIDAGSSISACGPAYVYMFIEAMADAGVVMGLTKKDSLMLSAKMVSGAGEMVLMGDHPATLKDNVCSPGGTTIEGVRVLEKMGFRGLVIEALIASYEKNKTFK